MLDPTHLDRDLVRLARDEAELDRQLAIGMANFWDRKCFDPLGYARATDFVREHLGIQESRARWFARLGRHLQAIPELDRALAQRRLDASHVIELGRILKEDTPAEDRRAWIDRGSRLSVRDLRKEVVAEIRRRKEAGEAAEPEPDPNEPLHPDDPPPGRWISIPAPVRVGVLWLGALELARKAAGRQLTQGQAAEYVFAEYLSAYGTDPSPTPPLDPLVAEVIAALNAKQAPAGDPISAAVGYAASLEAPVVLRQVMPAEDFEPDSSIAEIEDPWELAYALIRIAGEKHRLRFELAGLLTQFADQACVGALGYPGFERYCCDRLGFCLRRAERLIRFRAGLDRFPKLAAAYHAGHISYTAVLLLLPILHPTTEDVWVIWAKDLSYREVERVTEYARTFALPDTNPTVLASWAKGLEEQGLAKRLVGAVAESTPFAADPLPVPLGCALPPVGRGVPRIVGFPEDLALAPPEHCVARIRFWLPQDALDLAYRALDRCRLSLKNPLTPTWSVFEIILVHFIQTHDSPEAREIELRHMIVARDGYWCRVTGCTSREHLEDHHLVFRSDCGPECPWNRSGTCFVHHRHGVHLGILKIGGFAPDDLVFLLGIHPKTGKPFACYRNERRVSAEEAALYLAEWRRSLRERTRHMALSAWEETLPMALSAN
jgi:hypothetical protein